MAKSSTLAVKDKKIKLHSYFDSLLPSEKRPFAHKLCELCEISEAPIIGSPDAASL